jgi:negative regulator of sigma E activity
MNRDNQEFELRARTALDSSVTALDADTRRRLAAGRAKALEQKPLFSRWLSFGNWIPATALAACAVLAVVLFIAQEPPAPVQVAQTDPDVALEILLGNGDEQEADNDPYFYILMDSLMDDEDAQSTS